MYIWFRYRIEDFSLFVTSLKHIFCSSSTYEQHFRPFINIYTHLIIYIVREHVNMHTKHYVFNKFVQLTASNSLPGPVMKTIMNFSLYSLWMYDLYNNIRFPRRSCANKDVLFYYPVSSNKLSSAYSIHSSSTDLIPHI